MPSFLLLDADRSLSSIGGAPGVVDRFGLPPVPIRSGVADARRILNNLVTVETYRGSYSNALAQVIGDDIPLTRLIPNQTALDLGLEGLIIDTFSALADQEFDARLKALNARRRENGQSAVESLDQSTWGPYGNALVGLCQGLAQTDMTVVVTCHEKRNEDDSGFAQYEPNVRGSASSRMLRSFDAVLFSKIVGSGEEASFVWQTRADQSRPVARTRGLTLDHHVEQNYQTIIGAFREAGVQHPKILVIGESGTGKTTALTTLSPNA